MSHYSMNCGGECQISHEANFFIDTLKASIRVLAKDVASKLGINEFQMLWRSSVDPKPERPAQGSWSGWHLIFNQAVFRCDDAHDGLYMSPSKCARNKILRAMSDILEDRFQKSRSRFNASILIYLHVSVALKDSSALYDILHALPGKIPTCTLAYLLERAIGNWFDQGVKLLLEKGASPNQGILGGPEFQPLSVCSSQMVNARLGRADSQPLCQIWKLLLNLGNHETHPLDEDHHLGATFGHLCDIAIIDPESAELLIEMGADYLKSHQSNDDQVDDAPSTLWSVVKQCFDRESFSYSNREKSKIFAFAFLPLLRAGCRFSFSSFGKCSRAFAALFENAAQFDDLNKLIFGKRQNHLFELVAEGLVKPKKGDIVTGYSVAKSQWKKSKSDDTWSLQDRFCRSKPSSLQSLSRKVILSRLPFGLIARIKVIRELPTPHQVQDLLNFFDMEPLPESLV